MLNRQQNDGVHISSIMTTTSCSRHSAGEGDPCWVVWITTTGRFAPAVCGRRILRAGFNGKINPKSLSRWSNSDSTKPKAKSKYQKPRPSQSQTIYSK